VLLAKSIIKGTLFVGLFLVTQGQRLPGSAGVRTLDFLTQPEEIFLIQWGKNNFFWIFRANFPNPDHNQRWLTRPEQQKIDLTWVQKF